MVEASQRLNAGGLNYAYLVGLFEGNGFFTVTKKGDYFQCELGIELSIKDTQLIYKIKSLMGVGVVRFRDGVGRAMVYLIIRKKDHLKEIVIPIFDKYPLLSNKQHDYLRFKYALLSNLVLYKDLPTYIRPSEPLNSIEYLIQVPYFSAWLVGFIEAEGCFSVYISEKRFSVASFDISQTNGRNIILAIRLYLKLTPQIYKDNINNHKLKVTGVRSIENVIKFINKAPVKLLGNKRLQYLLWIKNLRNITRYADKIKIPMKY